MSKLEALHKLVGTKFLITYVIKNKLGWYFTFDEPFRFVESLKWGWDDNLVHATRFDKATAHRVLKLSCEEHPRWALEEPNVIELETSYLSL